MEKYRIIYPDGCEGYFNTLDEAKKEVAQNAGFLGYNINDYEIEKVK